MRFRLFIRLLAGLALYSSCGMCMENIDQAEAGLSLKARLDLSVCKNIRNETNSESTQFEEDMKKNYTTSQIKNPKDSFNEFLFQYASKYWGKYNHMAACFYDKSIRYEHKGYAGAFGMLKDLAGADNVTVAQAYLGFLYLDGETGIEKNKEEAAKWFDKAAAQAKDSV